MHVGTHAWAGKISERAYRSDAVLKLIDSEVVTISTML